MLQPRQTSPEKGPSTDVDQGGPRPGTSTTAETEMRAQRVESASQLRCASEEKLLQYFDDLSEDEWSSFSVEMDNAASRAEFSKTCTDIARVVHLTALNIVIPALYQMVDLQSRVSKSQTAYRPSSSGSSRSSQRSISFIEDDVDVMVMRNGVLSQIIRKKRRSRASVRSSRSSLNLPEEQHSPSHGTSLEDSKSATLCNEPKSSFALTKENVCISVIQSLGETLIDLQSQSLGPDLQDLSTHVVEEVVVSVFRALKTSGQRDVTVQETKDMLQRVSKELNESFAKKGVEKALVSPAEEETHKNTLASTAEKAMDAVLQAMEDCLDDVKESKPAKNILAAIRKVVRVVACQSTSLVELKADAPLTDKCNGSPSSEKISVSRMAQMLFNDEFHSKATLAVSDMLRTRGINSALGMNSRPTLSASPVGSVSGSKPAVFSRSAPVLLPSLPPPVGPGASPASPELAIPTGSADEGHDLRAETVSIGSAGEKCLTAQKDRDSKCDSPSGVKAADSPEKVMPEHFRDNEPGQILDSAASALIGHFVASVQKCEMELSALKRLSKANIISATAGLYRSMQNKVRQMFGMSQSESVVNPEASQQVETITDAQSLSPDADCCTKEIMTEILMVYKEQMAEGTSAKGRYSVTSFLGCQLIDDIMSGLGEESLSRPGTCIDENEDEEDADVTLPIKKVISSENFERNATAKVSQVLLKSTGSFRADVESDDSKLGEDSLLTTTTTLPAQSVASDDSRFAHGSLQTTTTSAQSTVSDILKTVVRGIEKLFHLRPSEDEADEAVSILQTKKRAEPTVSDSDTEIWHTAQNTFQMLESRLKDFYNLKMSSCVKSNQRAYADAKKAVSKVLVTLQKELPNSDDFEHSDDLRLMWTIVNAMIDNIEQMEEMDGNKLGVRKASSLEAQRSKTPSSLSSTAGPGCFSSCPIVRHTYIDMSDTGADHEAIACITQNTVIKVAKVILTKLGLVKDISASSTPRDDLSTVTKSVEKVLSSGSICQYSPNLTSEVYCLLLEGNKSPEAVALCAGKSVSDSILLNVGRGSERTCRKDSTFQLIKAYSVESVKYLLLPLFHFSSLGANQDTVLQASASRSCPTVLQSISGDVPCQKASRSPSEILDAAVTLVSNIIVSDIMEAASLSVEMLENDIGQSSLNVDRVSLSSSSRTAVLDQPGESQEKITATSKPQTPLDSNNEDHTSLVTLLVIRLLSQVQGQRDLSDDTLDMSRRLIDKVLNGFDAAPGNSQNDTCAQVNIHNVYRAIYTALVKEFGSANLVSKAMESKDSSFEETLIASLKNELMQTRTSVESVVGPAPTEDELEENRKQPRRGILRLLPKMPKINLKKFKIKKRNCVSTEGETTTTVSSNTASGVSSEEKPRRRNLFIRMISALTKKSS